VINTVSFFLFERVGSLVGAQTGTGGYREIAENLVRGNGYTSAFAKPSTIEYGYMKREPLYPLLLAMIFRLTGELSSGVLCFFHTSLSLISCCLLYRLGEMIFGLTTARWAALIYALHPISFWYSTRFASEVLTVPAVLLSLLVIQRFFSAPNVTRAIQVALSFGIATLTRSACVILLPVFLAFTLFKWRSTFRQAMSFAVVVVSVHLAIHSGWVLRNYLISDEIVPFTTNSGGAFLIGNNVVERYEAKTLTSKEEQAENEAQGIYRSVQNTIAASTPGISLPRLEARTDKELRDRARQFVLHEPLFMARKLIDGMCFIWFLSSTPVKSWAWMAIQMPLLGLGLLGLFRCGKNLTHTFLLALARYSMPIIPIVILFAIYGAVSLLESEIQPNELGKIHSSSVASV